MNRADRYIASASELAMERVHRDGRKEILAQFRNECDYVGNTRCLPESTGSKSTAPETPGAVRSLSVCFLYLTDT